MNNIEAVKEILVKYYIEETQGAPVEAVARQIVQALGSHPLHTKELVSQKTKDMIAKPDELISDKKIQQACKVEILRYGVVPQEFRDACQAQHAKDQEECRKLRTEDNRYLEQKIELEKRICQKRIEQVFEEIEGYFLKLKDGKDAPVTRTMLITNTFEIKVWWQALKNKYTKAKIKEE